MSKLASTPSQEPGIENSISRSKQSPPAGSTQSWAQPHFCSCAHGVLTPTTTAAPLGVALKHNCLEMRLETHSMPFSRGHLWRMGRVLQGSPGSQDAGAPLSLPLITIICWGKWLASPFPDTKPEEVCVDRRAEMTSSLIIWHYDLTTKSNVSFLLTCFTASSSRSSRNCLFMSLFCDPKMQWGLISFVWHSLSVKTLWHVVYGCAQVASAFSLVKSITRPGINNLHHYDEVGPLSCYCNPGKQLNCVPQIWMMLLELSNSGFLDLGVTDIWTR